MEIKSLLTKLGEIEQTAAEPAAGTTEIKEAYIRSGEDAIEVLANLRAMGKKYEKDLTSAPPGFAGQVVNDLWDVILWIRANIREDVTTEAKKPDFLDMDKDGDEEEPMSKALKDKEKVDEAMTVHADGAEAIALLNILKLAGMPTPQHAAEDREIELANTPSEHVFPHDAAVPSGTDLHKQKGAYRAAAGGDNAMAMEELKKIEGKLKGMFESMVAAGK